MARQQQDRGLHESLVREAHNQAHSYASNDILVGLKVSVINYYHHHLYFLISNLEEYSFVLPLFYFLLGLARQEEGRLRIIF